MASQATPHQAVRIPRELELPGQEVLLYRDGNRLVLEPLAHSSLLNLLSSWAPIDTDWPRRPRAPARRAQRTMTARYLLDTNVLSHLVRRPGELASKIAAIESWLPG